MRVAAGEGVEAGAENEVLAHAVVADGGGESVLGQPRSSHHKRPESGGERVPEAVGGAADFVGVLVAEDADGERIVEDERLRIVDLVRGSA
jgi:hypothetical protein